MTTFTASVVIIIHMRARLGRALVLVLCLLGGARGHSWLDCVDYDCGPAGGPAAGPQPPEACTCKGFPRNWAATGGQVPLAASLPPAPSQ